MLRQCVTRLSCQPRTRASYALTQRFHVSHPSSERAVIFKGKGNPTEVLEVKSYDPLPSPPPGSLNIRFRLSPINPSDINVVQGVYPAKPAQFTLSGEEVFVGGNEGLAEVEAVGSDVHGFKKGDWVISGKPQVGTWSSTRVLSADDAIKLPSEGLSEVNAATIAVRWPSSIHTKLYLNLRRSTLQQHSVCCTIL